MPLNLPPPKASTSSLAASWPASNDVALPAARLDLPSPDASAAAPSGIRGIATGMKLPPPKTKSKAAASAPKKFVLDLPKPGRSSEDGGASASTSDEPTAKKPRLNGSGLSGLLPEPGLSGLLPEPSKPASKSAAGLKLPEPKSSGSAPALGAGQAVPRPTSLLPHVLKGKGKASTASQQRAKELREADQAEKAFEAPLTEVPEESAVDFFGLGEWHSEILHSV